MAPQSQESLQQLVGVSRTSVKNKDLAHILNDPYARGDPAKASEVIELLDKSETGIVEPVKPSLKLLGAVNREGVSCYLDSLLFTMFAMLDSYEAMLHQRFDDEPRKRLALMLRLWVNLLRTGRLITTDIVRPSLRSRFYSNVLIKVIDTTATISACCMWMERSSGITSTRPIRGLFVYNGQAGSAYAYFESHIVPLRQRRC